MFSQKGSEACQNDGNTDISGNANCAMHFRAFLIVTQKKAALPWEVEAQVLQATRMPCSPPPPPRLPLHSSPWSSPSFPLSRPSPPHPPVWQLPACATDVLSLLCTHQCQAVEGPGGQHNHCYDHHYRYHLKHHHYLPLPSPLPSSSWQQIHTRARRTWRRQGRAESGSRSTGCVAVKWWLPRAPEDAPGRPRCRAYKGKGSRRLEWRFDECC